MKKRGRRWVVVAVVALAVALLVGALVFREQPPYEFLRGTKREWIRITPSPPYHDLCEIQYVTDADADLVYERARRELSSLGWVRTGDAFYSTGTSAERIMIFVSEPLDPVPAPSWTTIRVERIATPLDRFNAWLDWLMRR